MVVVLVKLDKKPPELRRAFRNSASAERHAARDLRYRCPHPRLSRRLLSPSRYVGLRSAFGRHAYPNTCAVLFRGLRSRQRERHPDSGDIRWLMLRTERLLPSAQFEK
jgi:hypothetical protein